MKFAYVRPSPTKAIHEVIFISGREHFPIEVYSPDLVTSDYHLFKSIKLYLINQRITEIEDIRKWLDEYFAPKPANFRTLSNRW